MADQPGFLRYNETTADFHQRCMNLSTFDCSEEEMLWLMMGPRRLPLQKIVPISAMLVVIFLTGVVGNVAVCAVIIRHPAMHTATNYYLFSLALSDLLLLLFGVPNDLSVSWHQYPYSLGIVFCKLRALISEAASYVSVLTIVAFSLERYLAICHPLHLYAMAGLRRALRIVAGLWLISLLSASPFAWYTTVSYYDYPPGSGNASLESAFCAMLELPSWKLFELSSLLFFIITWSSSFLMPSGSGNASLESAFCAMLELPSWKLCELSSLLFFIIPGLLIFGLYARMGLRIRFVMGSKHASKPGHPGTLNGVNGSVHGEARQAHSKKNIIRMLAAVVVAFFLCWFPFHFQRLFFIYGTSSPHYHIINEHLFYVAGVFYYISATVNPILYNVMSHRYRLAFRETLCCGKVRRSKSLRNHSSIRETTVNHTSEGTHLVRVQSHVHKRPGRNRRGSFGTETSLSSEKWRQEYFKEPKKMSTLMRKEAGNNNEGSHLIHGHRVDDDVSC